MPPSSITALDDLVVALALESPNKRGQQPGVRDGTIRTELTTLVALLNWGAVFRVAGRRLLAANPVHGVAIPRDKNAKRPLATDDRAPHQRARQPARRGRAALARPDGDRARGGRGSRRLGGAVAARRARFSAKFGKRGYESVVPLSSDARAALDVYLRQHPRARDVPLMPSNAAPHLACGKIFAGRWLRRAEKIAKLPKPARGAWHPFRRQWASERRNLPLSDVMAAGGWRSFRVMRESYQHAGGQGMLSVVESESRPKQQ